MLAWRRLRLELLIEEFPIKADNRFFIPEVTRCLGDDEFFVDAGAYAGTVTHKFVETTGGKYSGIYAFEPDSINFNLMKKALEAVPRVTISSAALFSKKCKMKFSDRFDLASRIDENGNKSVHAIPLDTFHLNASFIKMHLEGGELPALEGSLITIKKHRPILAITVYHNSDAVWKTPYFLMTNVPEYNFYFREHGWAGTGAVIYGIPKERRVH